MSKSALSSSSKKRSSYESSGNKSKQSSVTKNKLIQFFSKTAELQRKLQIIKEMLAEEEEFTPASLFHRLDTARKGYIVQQDIQNFLIGANIKFKGSDLKTLFGRINANKSSAAVYMRAFQNFILPNQNPHLRYFTMRRPVIVPLQTEKLSEKIEWITGKFFSQIMTQYTKLMEYNKNLVSSFDFDVNQVFEILSSDGKNITGQDIERFMKQNNIEISKEQIGCILKLIDKKGEGHLYKDDFKVYLATLGIKKEHQIFDELSPIPALKDFHQTEIKELVKDRDKTLKQRYKDNKSYVKGMDEEGHHILGYSRNVQQSLRVPGWLSHSHRRKI